MDPETQNLDAVFCAAIEIASPEERTAYIARACGANAELRARVEKLVAAHFRAGSFLADVERPAATEDAPLTEQPGAVIGPYKLLEQIGEGGFGVVFMAEQTQPVRRKVALKILKPGMDTRHVVARFEAERQALAIMDHPNIAKVLDGGATDSGRPYFVMELVKGAPITEYCDQCRLTPRQRLELFVDVCQAVQHAHQKGIIHRDLKPSNVLVTVHDTKPVVKVIDFGVAKALGQELTDKTLFTGFAQMIGTPLYMSPEQAGQSGLDIDTRSDIYSLGVLLYELLTGTTPFDKQRFKKAAFEEIRRIIREEDPPKPSTRLSQSKDALTSISAQRQTAPEKLTRLIRGELDWIVMKALEKDRGRRYESAASFALDVHRYLADEPVHACPPSAGYRLRKFARRNKTVLAMVGTVLGVLMLAVIGLAVANIEINDALTEKTKALDAETIALNDKKQALIDKEKVLGDLRVSQKKTSDALDNVTKVKNRLQQALSWHNIALADREFFLNNNVAKAEEILDECPADGRYWEWHYLKRLCHRELKVMEAAEPMGELEFSPDGKWLVANGARLLTVWNADKGEEPLRCDIKSKAAFAFRPCFSADNTRMSVLCIGSERMPIYDLHTRKEVEALLLAAPPLYGDARFSPDGKRFAHATPDGTIYVRDAASGLNLQRCAGDKQRPYHLALNGDGTLVAGADRANRLIKIWSVANGAVVRSMQVGPKPILSMAFAPNGQYVAVLSEDGLVRVVHAQTGVEHVSLSGSYASIGYDKYPVGFHAVRLTFSPDSTRIAVAGFALRAATIWDVKTGNRLYTFRGHTDEVISVAFSPDGKRLATLGFDKAIRIWDATMPPEAHSLMSARLVAGVSLFAANKRFARLAVVYRAVPKKDLAEVVVFNGADSKKLATFPLDGKLSASALALSPDGLTVAVVDRHTPTTSMVRFFDVASGKESGQVIQSAAVVRSLTFSPDGRKIVGVLTASFPPAATVWDVETRKVYFALDGPKQTIMDLRFSPDGDRLATANQDGTVHLWDLPAKKRTRTIQGDPTVCAALDFHPNGKSIATGGRAGYVKIWNAESGQLLQTLAGHAEEVRGVAWSPDGLRLASTSRDKTLTLWDPETRRELLTLSGLTGVNYQLAFTQDGHRLFAWQGTTISFFDGTPWGRQPAPWARLD